MADQQAQAEMQIMSFLRQAITLEQDHDLDGWVEELLTEVRDGDGSFNADEYEHMSIELDAWHRVVHEFRTMTIDLNEPRWAPLARAIECWGEELVALRSTQGHEVHESALRLKQEAREKAASPGYESKILEIDE